MSEYDDPAAARKVNAGGALFFGAFTAFLAGCVALSAYETYSLATTHEPITQRTRYVAARHPGPTGIGLLCLGVLLGHLFWGPAGTGRQWWE